MSAVSDSRPNIDAIAAAGTRMISSGNSDRTTWARYAPEGIVLIASDKAHSTVLCEAVLNGRYYRRMYERSCYSTRQAALLARIFINEVDCGNSQLRNENG